MRALSRTRAAALVLAGTASLPCMAAAPVYFDLGGLALAALGAVFALFVLVGRKAGAALFFVLLALFYAWSASESRQHRLAAERAHQVLSEQCLASAGWEQRVMLSQAPGQVLVQIDARLAPGAGNALRMAVSSDAAAAGVSFVRELPDALPADAVGVVVAIIAEPIEGAKDWRLNGLRTSVTNAAGQIVAVHTDYLRDFGWCLGEEPPKSIEKFLRQVLKRPVGLVAASELNALPDPVFSPQGALTPLQKGHFNEALLPLNESKAALARRLLVHRPAEAKCQTNAKDPFDDVVHCLQGTALENHIPLQSVTASHRLAHTWLVISNRLSDSGVFDAMDITERSPEGAVLRRWHVRFAGVPTLGRSEGFAVRNIAVQGGRLTADILLGREVEVVGGVAPGQSMKEWFAGKMQATVLLDGP